MGKKKNASKKRGKNDKEVKEADDLNASLIDKEVKKEDDLNDKKVKKGDDIDAELRRIGAEY
ncbi:hypothetical protein A2U01_0025843, partial [Trifolium medium]|nr:hypothetical protein [Trifolium medium]